MLATISDWLWTYVLIAALLMVGLRFTLASRFAQLRLFIAYIQGDVAVVAALVHAGAKRVQSHHAVLRPDLQFRVTVFHVDRRHLGDNSDYIGCSGIGFTRQRCSNGS